MKKKIAFIFVIVLLTLLDGFAQSSRYFRKTFGEPYPYMEDGLTVISLSNGYLVGANKYTSLIDANSYIIKTDLYGNPVWVHIYINTATNDLIVTSVVHNNNYYFAGGLYNASTLNWNGYLLKTDSSGVYYWQKMIGDSLISNSIYSIINASDGNLIATGWIEDTLTSNWQGYLSKIDTTGSVLWSKTFVGLYNSAIKQCIELPDGNLALIGRTEYALGSGKVWLLITDSIGNLISEYKYFVGNQGAANLFQIGNSFDKALDGGYIIGGHSGTSPNFKRGLLIKLDSTNQADWYNMLSSAPNGMGQIWESTIEKVKQLPDSSFISLGSLSVNGGNPYKIILWKVDRNGNEVWRRYFTNTNGYHSFGYGMDLTPDGGFILTGRTEDSTNAQVYLVKTNCLGYTAKPVANYSVTWNGNTATFSNLSLRADTCIYYFGDGDSAIVHLNDTTDVVHQYSGPGPWQAYLLAFACGEVDTIYQNISTGIENTNFLSEKIFRIYPNPASNSLSIVYHLPLGSDFGNLEIIDVLGKSVYSTTLNNYPGELELNISSLPKGTYQVKLFSGVNIEYVRKLVIVR